MELLERLRARSEQRNATAEVDCGDLGTLTAQALPIREYQALSGGPDGDRAVLYAACRALQLAGEQLRREGRIFRPDEIMQLVSDGEARTGADAVRRLSGLALHREPDGQSQEEVPPDGAARLPANLSRPAESRRTQPLPRAGKTAQSGEAGRADPDRLPPPAAPDETAGTDSGNRMDKIRPNIVQSSDAAGADTARGKVRLEPVQNGRHQSSETGPLVSRAPQVGQVSRESEDGTGRPESPSGSRIPGQSAASGLADRVKILAQRQRKAAESTREQILPDQTQHRTVPSAGQPAHRPSGQADTAPAKPVRMSPVRPNERRLHEIKSEFAERTGGSLHETKSEFAERTGGSLHKSKPEFAERTGESLHETKSEFAERTGESLHETKSEFAERTGGSLHKSKPESQSASKWSAAPPADAAKPAPSTALPDREELAREVVRLLVEGLRRAAGAR